MKKLILCFTFVALSSIVFSQILPIGLTADEKNEANGYFIDQHLGSISSGYDGWMCKNDFGIFSLSIGPDLDVYQSHFYYTKKKYSYNRIDYSGKQVDLALQRVSDKGNGLYEYNKNRFSFDTEGRIVNIIGIIEIQKWDLKTNKLSKIVSSYSKDKKYFEYPNDSTMVIKVEIYQNKQNANDKDNLSFTQTYKYVKTATGFLVQLFDCFNYDRNGNKTKTTESLTIITVNKNGLPVKKEVTKNNYKGYGTYFYNEDNLLCKIESEMHEGDPLKIDRRTITEISYELKEGFPMDSYYVDDYEMKKTTNLSYFNEKGEEFIQTKNKLKRDRLADGNWSDWKQMGY